MYMYNVCIQNLFYFPKYPSFVHSKIITTNLHPSNRKRFGSVRLGSKVSNSNRLKPNSSTVSKLKPNRTETRTHFKPELFKPKRSNPNHYKTFELKPNGFRTFFKPLNS